MKKNYDFRFKKTDASIFRALIKLLEKEDFDKISISRLCELSSINRTTFYDHYKDKNELLEAFIKDTFASAIISCEIISDNNSLLDQVDSILKLIDKKIGVFKSLIKSHKSLDIKNGIIYIFKAKCLLNDDLVFFIGGVSSVIAESLKNDNFDREYLYTYIRDLSFKFNLFNKNKEN